MKDLPLEQEQAAEAAAIQEALDERVIITLEKLPGSETFRRKIEASSSAAALHGVAALIRELAAALGTPVTSVLALLTVVMVTPTLRPRQGGEEPRERETPDGA